MQHNIIITILYFVLIQDVGDERTQAVCSGGFITTIQRLGRRCRL